jgi:hypothetical protein
MRLRNVVNSESARPPEGGDSNGLQAQLLHQATSEDCLYLDLHRPRGTNRSKQLLLHVTTVPGLAAKCVAPTRLGKSHLLSRQRRKHEAIAEQSLQFHIQPLNRSAHSICRACVRTLTEHPQGFP